MESRYNCHNRRKYSLKVHIVLVTKYRKQLLKGSMADDVRQKIFNIANNRGYKIIAMETDKDHIHILLQFVSILTVLEEKDILVGRVFCMQYRRSVFSNNTKIH